MTSDQLNILIPTDFSNNAWSATIYALNLYAERQCTFYFLNSLSRSHTDSRTYITTNYIESLTKSSKIQLQELKTRAMTLNNPKHRFEVISTSIGLTEAIDLGIKQHQIDMVVAGTKGATGLNKFFLGSNTVQMIEYLEDCPILTVPDEHPFNAPRQIAFPTDFNRIYEQSEIKALLDFTNIFNGHIYVLHINLKTELSAQQEKNMRSLQHLLTNHQHTFHWVEKSGTKADQIHQFVKDMSIDVLAMVNYKQSFIESLIKEPIIRKIGFKPTVPFFVIPG